MATILVVEDNPGLASLLCAVFGERGHQVDVCTSTPAALTRTGTTAIHAAVVDLLLGDRRGLEVIETLAGIGVPTVAMSGVFHRGHRISRQAAIRVGAKAHFDRPFDLAEVVTTVEWLLSTSTDPDAFDVTLDGDLPTPEADELVVALDPNDPCIEVISADAVASHGHDRPHEVAAVVPTLPESSRIDAGSLHEREVLALLSAARKVRTTGELWLRQGEARKAIRLRSGRPISAMSNLPAEKFGEWAVASGLVPPAELVRVLDLANQQHLKTGEAMIRLGLLAPDGLRSALSHQSSHIVSSTLEWSDGDYEIYDLGQAIADGDPLLISVPDLVHERVRRLSLQDLRSRLVAGDRLATHADSPFEIDELRLDGAQTRLLAAADGTKTVEDLLKISDLEEQEGLALLLALRDLRMLAPFTPPRSSQRIILV